MLLRGNTITRTTVLSSSNSNSAVNFSAGTKDVILTYPADKSVFEDANGVVSIETCSLTLMPLSPQTATATYSYSQMAQVLQSFTVIPMLVRLGLNCESNSHGVTLKGPPHSASATYSLELPMQMAPTVRHY